MKLSNGFTTYDVSVYTSNDDYLVDETHEHYFESMHDGRYYEVGDKSEIMWYISSDPVEYHGYVTDAAEVAPDADDIAEYCGYLREED